MSQEDYLADDEVSMVTAVTAACPEARVMKVWSVENWEL